MILHSSELEAPHCYSLTSYRHSIQIQRNLWDQPLKNCRSKIIFFLHLKKSLFSTLILAFLLFLQFSRALVLFIDLIDRGISFLRVVIATGRLIDWWLFGRLRTMAFVGRATNFGPDPHESPPSSCPSVAYATLLPAILAQSY